MHKYVSVPIPKLPIQSAGELGHSEYYKYAGCFQASTFQSWDINSHFAAG